MLSCHVSYDVFVDPSLHLSVQVGLRRGVTQPPHIGDFFFRYSSMNSNTSSTTYLPIDCFGCMSNELVSNTIPAGSTSHVYSINSVYNSSLSSFSFRKFCLFTLEHRRRKNRSDLCSYTYVPYHMRVSYTVCAGMCVGWSHFFCGCLSTFRHKSRYSWLVCSRVTLGLFRINTPGFDFYLIVQLDKLDIVYVFKPQPPNSYIIPNISAEIFRTHQVSNKQTPRRFLLLQFIYSKYP